MTYRQALRAVKSDFIAAELKRIASSEPYGLDTDLPDTLEESLNTMIDYKLQGEITHSLQSCGNLESALRDWDCLVY